MNTKLEFIHYGFKHEIAHFLYIWNKIYQDSPELSDLCKFILHMEGLNFQEFSVLNLKQPLLLIGLWIIIIKKMKYRKQKIQMNIH
jgi:hypothetical protein